MSKNKKQRQQPPLGELLAAIVTPKMGPSVDELVDSLRVTARKNVAFVRGVTASKQCCSQHTAGDGVVVMSSTAAARNDLVGVGMDPSMRPIGVVVIDGHQHNARLTAMLDVEDAKQLVNILSEAIAAAEAVVVEA